MQFTNQAPPWPTTGPRSQLWSFSDGQSNQFESGDADSIETLLSWNINACNCQNSVRLNLVFAGVGLCTALNWLKLHCGHFSDGVDTIKLRTDLVLNRGVW